MRPARCRSRESRRCSRASFRVAARFASVALGRATAAGVRAFVRMLALSLRRWVRRCRRSLRVAVSLLRVAAFPVRAARPRRLLRTFGCVAVRVRCWVLRFTFRCKTRGAERWGRVTCCVLVAVMLRRLMCGVARDRGTARARGADGRAICVMRGALGRGAARIAGRGAARMAGRGAARTAGRWAACGAARAGAAWRPCGFCAFAGNGPEKATSARRAAKKVTARVIFTSSCPPPARNP